MQNPKKKKKKWKPAKPSRFSVLIPSLPEALKEREHKSCGKRSGLGICAYLGVLFQLNEDLSKSRKMTDEQILAILVEEFPDRPGVLSFLSGKKKINHYRANYNCGSLTGEKPKKRSWRYNEKGQQWGRGKKTPPGAIYRMGEDGEITYSENARSM